MRILMLHLADEIWADVLKSNNIFWEEKAEVLYVINSNEKLRYEYKEESDSGYVYTRTV